MRTRVVIASLLVVAAALAVVLFLPRERTSGEEESPVASARGAQLEGPGDPPPFREARTQVGVPEAQMEPAATVGASTAPEDVALGTLRVRVVDPWDRPIADGVTVRAVPLDGSRPLSDLRRGRSEPVELRLPLGVAHRIEAKARRESSFFSGTYEPAYAGGAPIKVMLAAKAGRISGRVFAAESGDRVAEARLAAFLETEDVSAVEIVDLDAEGAFDFLFYGGDVELKGSGSGRETRSFRVRVLPGEWVRDLEVALPIAAHPNLRGRVVDDAGNPVVGASVSLTVLSSNETGGGGRMQVWSEAGKAETGREGAFRLDLPTADAHFLDVRAAWHEPTGLVFLDPSGEETEVEIVLARAGALRLRGLLPDGSPWIAREVVLARDEETILEATLRRDRMAGSTARDNQWARVVRPTRSFRAFGAVKQGGRAPDSREEPAPSPGEGDFVTFEGIVTGEIAVTLRDGTLVGKAKAYVVAGETTTVEVPLRRIEGEKPR